MNNSQDVAAESALTEIERLRTRLEEERIRTEAMLNSLGEGLIVMDEHGQITTVNSYALSALGFKEHELVGTWYPRTIISVNQNALPVEQLARPVIRALTTGQSISTHTRYLRKDGSAIPVFVTVSPILMDDRPVGAIEVFRDLTGEQELDVAKDEFVSLASHQLRTPATGIKSILAMIASGDFGPITAIQEKYLGKAIESNDRQLEIIEDMLNVALVNAGKLELEYEYADMASLLKQAIHEHLPLTQSRGQRINLRSPGQLMLFADEKKLLMVTDNLISNASKYSNPQTDIDISLVRHTNHAELIITDHGVGIPDTDINKLFHKFTRINNTLSSSVGGTGLGLFLVKSIIELHRGSIEVRSKVGEGTTFIVRLPLKRDTP